MHPPLMFEAVETLRYGLLAIVLAVAVVVDLRRHRIPNALTLAAAVAALAVQLGHAGLAGLGDGVAGLGVGLAAFLPLYFFGGMGAGDVKLMAAVGAFLGCKLALLAAALTLMVGGVLGLALLLSCRTLKRVMPHNLDALHFLSISRIPSAACTQPIKSLIAFPYALA